MKKLKIFSVMLLIISMSVFVAFRIYLLITDDNTPPVITCDSEEIEVSTQATDEELLKGVTAKDDKSGNVTYTLVVESLSALTEEGKRTITYTAVDGSNNVGRGQRTLVYNDYQAPVFHMSAPLGAPVGSSVDILGGISAESPLDGSLTRNIRYTLETVIDTGTVGGYPIEFQVTDSAGNTTYLSTQVEIYDKAYAGIKVDLSDYLVYAEKGQPFDPAPYYVGADGEGELFIQSDVNVEAEGVYYVDYIVNGAGRSGKSRLTVVVR